MASDRSLQQFFDAVTRSAEGPVIFGGDYPTCRSVLRQQASAVDRWSRSRIWSTTAQYEGIGHDKASKVLPHECRKAQLS